MFLLFALAQGTSPSDNFLSRYCGVPPPTDAGAIPGMRIAQLHVLHRHGDRSPTNLVTAYMRNITFDCTWKVYWALSSDPETIHAA